MMLLLYVRTLLFGSPTMNLPLIGIARYTRPSQYLHSAIYSLVFSFLFLCPRHAVLGSGVFGVYDIFVLFLF